MLPMVVGEGEEEVVSGLGTRADFLGIKKGILGALQGDLGVAGSLLEVLQGVVLAVGLQVPLQLLSLPPQPRRHLQVDVREKQPR